MCFCGQQQHGWVRSCYKWHSMNSYGFFGFLEKRLSSLLTLGDSLKRKFTQHNNNFKRSSGFLFCSFFFLIKETVFHSTFLKDGVLKVTNANIPHDCLFSFRQVRGQLPVVDRERLSEQNTFIIKYYLVKIFTRV